MLSDEPSPRIPIELLEQVVSYDKGPHFLDVLRSLLSSPHLLLNVRSIFASHKHSLLPDFVNALPKGALQTLTLTGGETWSCPLLRNLDQNVFPFVTSLFLRSLDGPISLCHLEVTLCELLPEDHAEYKDLFDEKGANLGYLSSLAQFPLPIKLLELDGTRNSDATVCPLVDLITDGRCPSLTDEYFPLEDIGVIMRPLMNQLRCLDIGYWSEFGDETAQSRHLEHFQLLNYPQLQFFSLRLGAARYRDTSLELTRQLTNVSRMFETLAGEHPLKIFVLRLPDSWMPVDLSDVFPGYPSSEGWDKLDQALKNPHLSSLSKFVVSFDDKKELIPVFERNLPHVRAVGKLNFQPISMIDFFWSLSENERG
ncbi:hypothetical protein DL96DRAFT_1623116 [Flagelloscypha sp. PMI_526]|nr:hypothetical protein DL96DRAFT_1623116 [Flagelloscypha sp. PMI_526]